MHSTGGRPFHIDPSSKHFEFKEVEENMYKWWEESGFMKPTTSNVTASGTTATNESYCISMPPPNVTGSLHIG
jgi:valyl-tRNA synthetase